MREQLPRTSWRAWLAGGPGEVLRGGWGEHAHAAEELELELERAGGGGRGAQRHLLERGRVAGVGTAIFVFFLFL